MSLNNDVFQETNQFISLTAQDIKDALLLFIIKNCKNIEFYKNDIPIHFNDTKRIQYTYISLKPPTSTRGDYSESYNINSAVLTLNYDTKNNKMFELTTAEIIKNNINSIFQKNGIYTFTSKITKIEDIIKCCYIALELIKRKVLRVYFPLTNNYCYFYDATSKSFDSMAYFISDDYINLSREDSIRYSYMKFLDYITGHTSENTNQRSIHNKINLFYSFLYNVTINILDSTKYDLLNRSTEETNDDSPFSFDSKYELFHTTIT